VLLTGGVSDSVDLQNEDNSLTSDVQLLMAASRSGAACSLLATQAEMTHVVIDLVGVQQVTQLSKAGDCHQVRRGLLCKIKAEAACTAAISTSSQAQRELPGSSQGRANRQATNSSQNPLPHAQPDSHKLKAAPVVAHAPDSGWPVIFLVSCRAEVTGHQYTL
jgi:hypothetical protein